MKHQRPKEPTRFVQTNILACTVLSFMIGCGAENPDGHGGAGGSANGWVGAAGSSESIATNESDIVHDPRWDPPAGIEQAIAPPSNATACTMGSQCPTGYCVDGFCCDSKCDNKCMACSAAKKGSGADGICGSVKYDTDPDNDCPYGACDGKNMCKNYNGFTCTSSTQCLSNYCVDGYCCGNICMGECQACSAAKKGSGINGVCGNIAAGTNPDGECNGGGTCNGSTCTTPQTKQANGTACSTSTQCASGYCADGVCCDSWCLGTCQACTAAKKNQGADGVCGPIANDKDPDEECWGGACNGAGVCKQYNGVPCSDKSQCLSGYCVDGFCCGNICTGMCYACSEAKKGQGYDGVCGPMASGKDPENECNPGECNGSGTCNQPQTPQANGTTCVSGGQCASGNCVDGYCCDAACTGICQACSTAKKGSGANGTCGPIASETDPDGECGVGGRCGGNGTCRYYNGAPCTSTGQCFSNYCVDGVCCGNVCTSTCYACSAAKKGQGYDGSCGPIANTKDPDDECNPGECNGSGACNQSQTPQANGAACSLATQCASGFCVDGVCCDSACSDTCTACTAAKKGSGTNGTCGNIKYDTDPENECLAGACSGSGTCQYYNGATCTSTAECLSNYCVDGYCCNNHCGGTCYACSADKKGGGLNGSCGLVAANTDPDDECGVTCDGAGACIKAPNGTTCATATDCVSGLCVDGVCCDNACTGTCMACSAAKKGSGSDGTCDVILANTDPDDECPLGKCDGAAACSVLLANGSACSTDAECGSDHCVDGVCCNTACTGTCFACDVAGSVGTCTPIPAGQSDPTGTPACNDICNGAGQCIKNTGGACTSGSECVSRICNKMVCDSPKPANGPLQWMTIPTGYNLDVNEIAAFNNGQGVAVVGWWTDSMLKGSFSADGMPNLMHYGSSGNQWSQYSSIQTARGGVVASYEMTDRWCPVPWEPCNYSCNISQPSGLGFAPLHHLIGKNDAGQVGAIVPSNYNNYCAPISYGTILPNDQLLRASAGGVTELSMPVPAGIQAPIVLGPAGEFHWSSGASLIKTNVNGTPLWTKSPIGSIASSQWDVDAAGNILIAVSFSGTINYGAGPMTAAGPQDLGLIKLDPAGNVVWQKQFGSSMFTMGDVNGLSRTATGDMTVWGNHTGPIDFGTGTLSGAKFIVKFDASGNALWHVDLVSADMLLVAGDLSGAVYVASPNNYTNVDFGWGAVNAFFMAKYQ